MAEEMNKNEMVRIQRRETDRRETLFKTAAILTGKTFVEPTLLRKMEKKRENVRSFPERNTSSLTAINTHKTVATKLIRSEALF